MTDSSATIPSSALLLRIMALGDFPEGKLEFPGLN